MTLARDLSSFPRGLTAPVVAFGNFDGVHLGHRAMLERLISEARRRGGASVAMTFRPHPVKILHPERAPSLICTYDEKLRLIEASGVDVVLEVPFDRDFSEWSAERFVEDLLVGLIGASHILLGPDSHFGKGRRGDAALLASHGQRLGFTVEALAPVVERGGIVSSSRIRHLVADEGDVAEAAHLLGRRVTLVGDVVKGHQRGRLLGFPTANLRPVTELMPRTGVYAAEARVSDGGCWPAVVNIGYKPTFGAEGLTVEAHLLDFDGDLYGDRVTLELASRVRSERRFDGVDALVAQIGEDVADARRLLARHAP